MRKHTELRVEPWTVVVAVVIVALFGLLLFRGGMGSTGMNPQAMMMQSMKGIDKALNQVNTAISHMDEASKAPDSPSLQKHAQLAKDVLAGKGGMSTQMKMMEEMMKGPMMNMAQKGMSGMSMEHHTNMMTAMQTIQANIQGALEHVEEVLEADKSETAQEHIRLGTEQLKAALGSSGSTDPKTGGLTYLKEQMTQMMGRMK